MARAESSCTSSSSLHLRPARRPFKVQVEHRRMTPVVVPASGTFPATLAGTYSPARSWVARPAFASGHCVLVARILPNNAPGPMLEPFNHVTSVRVSGNAAPLRPPPPPIMCNARSKSMNRRERLVRSVLTNFTPAQTPTFSAFYRSSFSSLSSTTSPPLCSLLLRHLTRCSTAMRSIAGRRSI